MKTVKLELAKNFKNDTGLFLKFTSKCLLAARPCIDEIHYIEVSDVCYGYIKLTYEETIQVYLNEMIQEVLNA